jgi:hypothetical protein
MKFKYSHIQNQSKKLLVYFNDMTQVGHSDHFSLYKQLNRIFSDYDILFIKDIAEYYWYLTIIDDILELLHSLNHTFKYDAIYGFAGSSGCMGLLNTLPKIAIFKRAIVINGQVSLASEDVEKYRNCRDCYLFSKEKIQEEYHQAYLTPLLFIQNQKERSYQIRFYHNTSVSDSANHHILREKYRGCGVEAILEESHDTPFHGNYLMKRYRDSYLEEYKKYLGV